jgi:4-diphosphocytidyl-2-C-methyl-D-erythritol kinase
MEQPVVARGRGEELEPVAVRPLWWVLVAQPFLVPTADAYRWWDEGGHVAVSQSVDALFTAASLGDAVALGDALFNDLEEPVSSRHPEIAQTKERLLDEGAVGAVMCGSGPTIAGLAREEAHARAIAEAVSPAWVVVGPP